MTDTNSAMTPSRVRIFSGSVGRLIRSTFAGWYADRAPKLGAALAFYTVFSLAPLLVISLAIAGSVYGEDAARGELQEQLDGLLGAQGARAVQSLLANAREPSAGFWAATLGGITLFVGASGVFGELQDSLNIIWKVTSKPSRGLWQMIRTRILSLTMVLVVGFLLLVSLVISTLLSGMVRELSRWMGGSAALMQPLNVLVSLALITLLLAMIFKFLPNATIAWRDVWYGALLTATLFTIGKQLIGMYLGRASIGSAYGAAGSVVLVLLWAYYSAQVLFLGAEFTRAYACIFGSHASATASAAANESSTTAHSARE